MKSKREEFLEILMKYQGILHKVNLVYFKNQTEREDNFQEMVYQMWKSFPQLQKRKSIGSWIYAVAINTSLSGLKKNTRINYQENLPEYPGISDAYREMEINEDTQLLMEAIHNLNEIDRSILLLYLEEKSYDEIAQIIGITNSNVGVRINRAKETLKKHLKPLYHGK
ncbi:MAG: sigma-70 family RNA polymerase sigma factor [Bacteroidales bacterium]|nr:sigma-70 family RNA polymerase sigma factor [Bacteroidales bacterium]